MLVDKELVGSIRGYKVYTDNSLTDSKVDYETKEIKRSWWERIFSWSPCKPYKYIQEEVTTIVPSSQVMVYGDILIMHPVTFNKLKDQIC